MGRAKMEPHDHGETYCGDVDARGALSGLSTAVGSSDVMELPSRERRVDKASDRRGRGPRGDAERLKATQRKGLGSGGGRDKRVWPHGG